MTPHPLVSIIIPVFNESRYFQACLESLHQQTYSPLETIVIDDGSTDNSPQIAQSFPKIKFHSQSHQGPGAARNLGAKKSTGQILVFIDADMTFPPDFITHLTQPIRSKKVIGTFTNHELVANTHNPFAIAWNLVRHLPADRMLPPHHPDTQPVFRAITQKAFRQAGGFDTNRGYDDDWSLSQRLGILAQNTPKAIIYHHNPDSLKEIFIQSKWVAKRQYKFGILGKIITLIRSSLPASIFKACYLTFTTGNYHTIPVQFVFDLGITSGLLESIFTSKTSK